MLWQHGGKELKKFLEILNSYHPNIKFTINYSTEKIRFLDVEVTKKGASIRIILSPGNVIMVATDLYGKSPYGGGYTELRESMTFCHFCFHF